MVRVKEKRSDNFFYQYVRVYWNEQITMIIYSVNFSGFF